MISAICFIHTCIELPAALSSFFHQSPMMFLVFVCTVGLSFCWCKCASVFIAYIGMLHQIQRKLCAQCKDAELKCQQQHLGTGLA